MPADQLKSNVIHRGIVLYKEVEDGMGFVDDREIAYMLSWKDELNINIGQELPYYPPKNV